MEITLSDGSVATVDAADYPALAAHRWRAGTNRGGRVYAIRHARRHDGVRTTVTMHRAILGVTDLRIEVDHINGNTLDNRRENLRACSQAENARNKHRRTATGLSSRFKGVTWHRARGLWQAAIKSNHTSNYLGLFADEHAAAEAYNAAAVRLHGEFACLNVLT